MQTTTSKTTQQVPNPFAGEPLLVSPFSYDYFVEQVSSVFAMTAPAEHSQASFMGLEPYADDTWVSYRKGSNGFVQVQGMIVPDAPAWYSKYNVAPLSVIRSEVSKMEADPSIEKIYFLYNTPGGVARSLTDFWHFVQGLTTPNVGYVTGQAASAGYFIISAHSQIISSEMGAVGSIGTKIEFFREDRYLANQGIDRVTVVSEQSPNKDLLAPGKEHLLQQQTNKLTEIFVSYVAKGLKVSEETVLEKFGQGNMLIASDALAVGMIHKIATLDELLAEMPENKQETPLSGFQMNTDEITPSDDINTPISGTTEGEQIMNINDLKLQHPELVSQLETAAASAALSAEQTRVSGIAELKAELGDKASPASMKAADEVIAKAMKDPKATVEGTRATMFQAAFMAKDEVANDVKAHGEKVAEAAHQMGNTTPNESKAFDVNPSQAVPTLQAGFDELDKLRKKNK